MKLKGVAVPYVIALILGVMAIALLGYWFLSQGGRTISAGEKTECDGKQFTYCVQWKSLRFSGTPPSFGLSAACPAPERTACETLLNLDCSSQSDCTSSYPIEYPPLPSSTFKRCCKR